MLAKHLVTIGKIVLVYAKINLTIFFTPREYIYSLIMLGSVCVCVGITSLQRMYNVVFLDILAMSRR